MPPSPRAPSSLEEPQQLQQQGAASAAGSSLLPPSRASPNKATEEATLRDLTKSAYHLVHVDYEDNATSRRSPNAVGGNAIHSDVQPFYKALCDVVVLANLEVCTLRNISLTAGRRQGASSRASSSGRQAASPSSPPVVAQLANWEVQLDSINQLPRDWKVLIRDHAAASREGRLCISVEDCIKEKANLAEEELKGRVTQALTRAAADGSPQQRVEVEKELTLISKAYAAYRADLLGPTKTPPSPAEPDDLPGGPNPVAPKVLADLAVQLLQVVAEKLPEGSTLAMTRTRQQKGPKNFPSNTLKKLLRAACQSGQYELVERLLDFQNESTTANGTSQPPPTDLRNILMKSKADSVLGCFCAAWIGYAEGRDRAQQRQRTKDPDRLRRDPQDLRQENDWLDYKHSSYRAQRIAYRLVQFIIRWWKGRDSRRIGAGVDLQEENWDQLQRVLRERPGVACKPLAAALLQVAKETLRRAKDSSEDASDTADTTAAADLDAAAEAAAANLAVKACAVAIAADSVEAVEDAVEFLSDHKQSWPALSLELLTQLAGQFPHQTVSLLAKMDLTQLEESTFDNVLPFRLTPGFRAIAVSTHDQHTFGQKSAPNGHSLGVSTKDSEHFSTQTTPDPTIEGSLLIRPTTWLGFLLLFDGREARSPTVKLMKRTVGCISLAFLSQGPGSLALWILAASLLGALAVLTRICAWVVIILMWPVVGVLRAAWQRLRAAWQLLRRLPCRAISNQVVPAEQQRPSDPTPPRKRSSIWRGVNAPHWAVVNWLLGWGRRSTMIACRKVPMTVDFSTQHDSKLLEELLRAPDVPSSVFNSKVLRALITYKWHYFTKYFIMMQLVLHLIYMSVFLVYGFSVKDIEPIDGRPGSGGGGGPAAAGAEARSRILKDTSGSNSTSSGGDTGGNSGGDGVGQGGRGGIMFGAQGPPSCQLPAPTTLELGYLIALGAITIDLALQEMRQIVHFGRRYFYHAWDVLDILSVVLMTVIIVSHFMCSLGPLEVSPDELRLMIAGQTLLLFTRLLYYAMAFDRLGEFVSMVLSTFQALAMFAAFLVVVVFGFAVSIILAQGNQADLGNEWKVVIMKLYTMIYGDFDLNFLDDPWSSTDLEANHTVTSAISIFIALFMLVVTIVLLNLLIAIVNESYNTIRTNARYESLRNKAFLIVSTESLLRRFNLGWPLLWVARCCQGCRRGGGGDSKGLLIDWIYTTLSAPLSDEASNSGSKSGNKSEHARFVYLITPERSRAQRRDDTRVAADEDEPDLSERVDEVRRLMSEFSKTQTQVKERFERLESAQQQRTDARRRISSGGGGGEGGSTAAASSSPPTAAPPPAPAPAVTAVLSDADVAKLVEKLTDVFEPLLRREAAAAGAAAPPPPPSTTREHSAVQAAAANAPAARPPPAVMPPTPNPRPSSPSVGPTPGGRPGGGPPPMPQQGRLPPLPPIQMTTTRPSNP